MEASEGQLTHSSVWHHHLGDQSDDEDQDCCRICRGSAAPLYYPCKCSGSIKYVHQQCLMDWLGHSGNTHCELCKHEFVFTPVYAKDAPTRLPWAELIAGLIKRAVGAVRVAHRVWVVACVWLIAVPWITCLAWRLAFLRSFDEVPRLLRERWNVLAIATDCIQGSLLSIGVVFVNMSVFSLKQHLKNAVRRLENQLLRDAAPAQQAQPAAAAAAGAAAAVYAPAATASVQPASAHQTGAEQAAGAMGPAGVASGAELAAAGAGAHTVGFGAASTSASAAATSGVVMLAGSATGMLAGEQPIGHSAAAIGSADRSNSSSAGTTGAPATGTQELVGTGNSTNGSSSSASTGLGSGTAAVDSHEQEGSHQQPQQQLEQQQLPGDTLHAAAYVGVGPGADEAMLAAAAAVGAVADPGGGADAGAAEAADVWGDVPIEELLGLQGPWVDFVEMVVLLLAGNASFMAGCVYLPLNIGRLMLMAIKKASAIMTQEQHQLLIQLLVQHVRLPFINELLAFCVTFLGTHLPAVQDSVSAATGAAAAAAASAAPAAVSTSTAGVAGVLYHAMDASDPMSLLPLNLDLLLKELQAQMELPARADFVALSMGHALLGLMLLVGLWLYVSMRLWRAARRRLQASGRRPLLQVMRSTGRWLLSAATMVCQGSKLVLLLSLELGAFPVFAGLWLDFCALPLTASSAGQRSELLAKAPVISALMHWVIGVGFVLAFTFLLCVLREVLRPGALPFIKDPTNPERNPVREMLDEPLVKHLGRVAMTWLGYAGLCVILVHFPALIAKSLVPSLYPLRLALFDPLTQIPADMLLMHIFIPFTVEHVRVKGAVKAAVQAWLRMVARLLNWSDYLLPADQARHAAAAAAAAQARQAAADREQPQQPAAVVPDAASTLQGAASLSDTATALDQGDQQQSEAGPSSPATVQQQQQAPAEAAKQPAQQQQQPQQRVAMPSLAPQQQQQQQQEQLPVLPQPVQWYEQQSSYSWKVLGLVLVLLATMVLLNTLLLTLPIGLGRALFTAMRLPFKNDLFTGIVGLVVLSGAYTLAAAVASSASLMNLRAFAAAAWRWGLLMGQCGVLMVLWLGVVATMLGMLCELVLLPLRLPPNQTALIYLYQDWTMGVLALKLWHLVVMVAPRRDGRAPPDPDSWQAHFDALQAGGLRNLDLNRALTKIVLPVLLNLSTCLAVPYVVTRGLLPLLGLPAAALQYANLYGHQIFHGCYLAYLGSQRLAGLAVQLHNTIRDDRYLVGRELHNFELQRREEAAAAAAAASAAAKATAVGDRATTPPVVPAQS